MLEVEPIGRCDRKRDLKWSKWPWPQKIYVVNISRTKNVLNTN